MPFREKAVVVGDSGAIGDSVGSAVAAVFLSSLIVAFGHIPAAVPPVLMRLLDSDRDLDSLE